MSSNDRSSDKVSDNVNSKICRVRRLCHQLCFSSCVQEKRQGRHVQLLAQRPHWSVLKRVEQMAIIDRGETVPFDITLPLPARDERAGSDAGIRLFWERFHCQQCGRCCYTPGAGLYLEKKEYEGIAKRIGKKKLRSLCRYDRTLKAWLLKQPCPFYDKDRKGCSIYDIRPSTCAKYPLHPPSKEMPYHLAVDAFCPAARELAKETLGWWIICENNWAALLHKLERDRDQG